MNHKLQTGLRLGFCTVTLGALLLPLVLTNYSTDTANAENRTRAEFPSFKTDADTLNMNYTKELDNWFSDSFGLRQNLVTAYGNLTRKIFATSSENDVITGKDGWLYYTPTADDITGVATMTETDAKHLVRTVEIMCEYAEKHGSKLIFTVAPDKGSIYPEYLPARFLQTGGTNNLDLVTAQLVQTSIPYCDLRTVLRENADHTQLYHKLDTHWNGAGAMLGFSALRQALGRSDCGFSNAETSLTRDFEGDLWKMLSPSVAQPDENIVYHIPQTYTYKGRFRSVDDLKIQTTCADGTQSLLMYRDSFGRALIPLLSQSYAECTYLRGDRVSLKLLEDTQFDDIIIEIVERNLPQFLEYAPVQPAPEFDPESLNNSLHMVADKDSHVAVQPQVFAEQSEGYLHIYGTYHEICSDSDRVFCELNGHCYEAFPCYETTLLGENHCSSNGFSLYLPTDVAQNGDTIRIVTERGTEHFDLGIQNLSLQPATEVLE